MYRQFIFICHFNIFLLIFTLSNTQPNDDKFLLKLSKTTTEKDAVRVIKEIIYQDAKFSDVDALKLMKGRKWLKATKLIFDFINNISNPEVKNEIENLVDEKNTYIENIKAVLLQKKKNIVRLSPIFEWSQDHEIVKIRLKFAKNLESPGEKGIQNFQVECKRNHLKVQGYKMHEDYVAHYYRNVHLYDFIKHYTCDVYKETEGTFIIKAYKGQPTLYWNFLDQPTEDHSNMFTWFDMFTSYDDKVKYTEFREFANQNLLEQDVRNYVQENMEDKKLRLEKIEKIKNYFRTKDSENKNFCNSPINEKFCFLVNYYDWNYWLS